MRLDQNSAFYFRVVLYGVAAVAFAVLLLLPLKAMGVEVPAAANRWKHELTRQTRLEWGLGAPVATFAAQVQQESGFRPDARSPVGALGIAQFMPATATWIAGAYDALGPSDPLNPTWALRAMARYDLHLFERVRTAVNDCERMAFTLSAYNGGEKFRDRGINACAATPDCNPTRWFSNVELIDDGRSPAAWGENRGYPLNILLVREPAYVAAAWGKGMCQ